MFRNQVRKSLLHRVKHVSNESSNQGFFCLASALRMIQTAFQNRVFAPFCTPMYMLELRLAVARSPSCPVHTGLLWLAQHIALQHCCGSPSASHRLAVARPAFQHRCGSPNTQTSTPIYNLKFTYTPHSKVAMLRPTCTPMIASLASGIARLWRCLGKGHERNDMKEGRNQECIQDCCGSPSAPRLPHIVVVM